MSSRWGGLVLFVALLGGAGTLPAERQRGFARVARLHAWAAALLLLVTALWGAGPAAASSPRSRRPTAVEADQGPQGPGYVRHPLWVRVFGYTATGKPIYNPTPNGPPPGAYTPAQIRHYLSLTGDGAGVTVVVTGAFHNPKLKQDVNTFSAQFGLPKVCDRHHKKNCFHFVEHIAKGAQPNTGWGLEAALDVEWVHAIAPKAKIVLESAKDNGHILPGALDDAGHVKGVDVISNSWGGGEFLGETAFDFLCQLTKAVCTFSTGDQGNPGEYPAYNPFALAVGGTSLVLDSDGNYVSETAWSGSGGGVSSYEPKPSYQQSVNSNSGRGIPDVSFDADPSYGVAVYDASSVGWLQVGGTSLSSPVWAGIIAVADQLRIGLGKATLHSESFSAHGIIYALGSSLNDITSGTNGGCVPVCQAGLGYDFVTGLGTPKAGIDQALAAAP